MRTIQTQRGPIRSLAYSPDGSILASGGNGQVILLSSVADGRILAHLEGHNDWVRALAFSPDGRQLASAGWDDTVRLWALGRRPRQHMQLSGYVGGAWSLAYSHDGALAAGAGDGTVRLHRSLDDRNPLTVRAHRWPVSAIVFSPDGQLLLTASHDRTLQTWSASWGHKQLTFTGHSDWVRSAHICPQGLWAGSGADDGRVLLWDLASGQEVAALVGHSAPVSVVQFCPHEGGLLSVGWDGTARLWDVASRRQRTAYAWNAGRLLALAVAPDGMTAATGAEDGSIIIWDLDPTDE